MTFFVLKLKVAEKNVIRNAVNKINQSINKKKTK